MYTLLARRFGRKSKRMRDNERHPLELDVGHLKSHEGVKVELNLEHM